MEEGTELLTSQDTNDSLASVEIDISFALRIEAYRHDRGKRKRRKRHSQNGHPRFTRRDLRRDLSATQ